MYTILSVKSALKKSGIKKSFKKFKQYFENNVFYDQKCP